MWCQLLDINKKIKPQYWNKRITNRFYYRHVFRFCKGAFDKNYKATIGVDFEMERFEVLGVPFSLQLWVGHFACQDFSAFWSTFALPASHGQIGLIFFMQNKLNIK